MRIEKRQFFGNEPISACAMGLEKKLLVGVE